MKKLLGLTIVLSLILAAGIAFATGGTSTTVTKPGTTTATPQPLGPCCIAGKYAGFHKDNPAASKTCPKPGEGKFVMEINQDKGCGSKIWGTVTNPTDPKAISQTFEGKVISREKCCYIEGTMKRPGKPAASGAPAEPPETTKFSGTLCKKDGKWSGKGNYTTTRGTITCNGTWEMSQM